MPQNRLGMGADHATGGPPRFVAFAAATLDRAAHLRADGQDERLRRLESSRVVMVGEGQTVAVSGSGGLALTQASALAPQAELTFLGLDRTDGSARFAYDAVAYGAVDADPALEFAPLRALSADLDPAEAALAAYAVAMVGWHRVTRFCGRSGHATVVEVAGHRRRCPGCGMVHFPRTDPAITMLVQAGERCLLSRRRGAPPNRWSALAGFVEPGETPEQAIVREAREETGVEVAEVQYVTAQPWPFPSALMLGYWAYSDGPAADVALTPAPEELLAVRWYERAELAGLMEAGEIALPPPGTIGNYLISTWLAERQDSRRELKPRPRP